MFGDFSGGESVAVIEPENPVIADEIGFCFIALQALLDLPDEYSLFNGPAKTLGLFARRLEVFEIRFGLSAASLLAAGAAEVVLGYVAGHYLQESKQGGF